MRLCNPSLTRGIRERLTREEYDTIRDAYFGWRRGVVVSGVRTSGPVSTRMGDRLRAGNQVYHLGMLQAN